MLQGHQGLLRHPPLNLAAAATAAACVLVPAAAEAHGVVRRANLPIPEWLFGWAAAVVLLVSFVALAALWPEPKLEQDRWRPLAGALGRVLGSRSLAAACGATGVALLALVVVAGLAGRQSSLNNFAPAFIFIVFWVGLVFASALFGNVFAAFSPWRALGRGSRGRRSYPERLGRWPAAAGLLVFTWIELVSGWSEEPRTLAFAVLGYTAITLAAQTVYGVDEWTRRGETFAVYFDLFARVSPFERRGRSLGVRPPLAGLPRLDPAPGTVALLAVMIGSVSFDGFSQGRIWSDLTSEMGEGAEQLASTLGLLAGVALVGGFYALGVAGARSVGGGLSAATLRGAFVHSLVPIAMVYVAAHYLTLLVFEGQSVVYLLSDPLGEGWNLLGTATSGIDYGVLSQNQAWYLQVGFVVAGHVAALVLAHDRALALHPGPRPAVRSQYWMVGVMVGFTTLALWLLAATQG